VGSHIGLGERQVGGKIELCVALPPLPIENVLVRRSFDLRILEGRDR